MLCRDASTQETYSLRCIANINERIEWSLSFQSGSMVFRSCGGDLAFGNGNTSYTRRHQGHRLHSRPFIGLLYETRTSTTFLTFRIQGHVFGWVNSVIEMLKGWVTLIHWLTEVALLPSEASIYEWASLSMSTVVTRSGLSICPCFTSLLRMATLSTIRAAGCLRPLGGIANRNLRCFRLLRHPPVQHPVQLAFYTVRRGSDDSTRQVAKGRPEIALPSASPPSNAAEYVL